MIWAYLGPAALEPPHPDHELLRTPPGQRYMTKSFEDCNYLQALEGGVDPTHARILHNSDIGDRSFINRYDELVAELHLEKTDYGFTYAGIRSRGRSRGCAATIGSCPSFHMRGSNRGPPRDGAPGRVPTVNGHIWVPIDDEHAWVYNFDFLGRSGAPLSREKPRSAKRGSGAAKRLDAGFARKRNRSNDYMIDRTNSKRSSMTGIDGHQHARSRGARGHGPIGDRSRSISARPTGPIIMLRQILLDRSIARRRRRDARPSIRPTYRNVRVVRSRRTEKPPWRDETKCRLSLRGTNPLFSRSAFLGSVAAAALLPQPRVRADADAAARHVGDRRPRDALSLRDGERALSQERFRRVDRAGDKRRRRRVGRGGRFVRCRKIEHRLALERARSRLAHRRGGGRRRLRRIEPDGGDRRPGRLHAFARAPI